MITKLILENFKKFESLEINFNSDRNILIGDNEAGKSTILEALDIVLSGSRQKIESVGLETLFNNRVVDLFMNSGKYISQAPKLKIEVFFDEQNNPSMNGLNNSKQKPLDGLKLECFLENDFFDEATQLLNLSDPVFPFELYTIRFTTFSGRSYSGRIKTQNFVYIDTHRVSEQYAMRDFVRSAYMERTELQNRNDNLFKYRKMKDDFAKNLSLSESPSTQESSSRFMFKATTNSSLIDEMTVGNEGIRIENRGKGLQNLIKTDFIINRKAGSNKIKTFLVEEPENHLSKINLYKFIELIQKKEKGSQIFIATHNELICSRLDLRNVFFIRVNSSDVTSLKDISPDTAKFFMKSSNRNILELVLSPKVILVEGDSEYMLAREFYMNEYGKYPEVDNINIINVGGITFKRFLDVGKILRIKIAVLRDNDKDYQRNCVDNYIEYVDSKYIRVFSEQDPCDYTFEILVYKNNKEICDDLFSSKRTKSTKEPCEYMLANKTESAYMLLNSSSTLTIPRYFKEAFEWIR